jgi:hypothetical protein
LTPILSLIGLTHRISNAIRLVIYNADPDAVCHAFEVIVKFACGHFAGAYSCYPFGFLGVLGFRHESIAARVHAVADGDSAGMAIIANVIGALGSHAFRNKRHFDGNLVHNDFPFFALSSSYKKPGLA